MRIDILTLFPEMIDAVLGGSIIGRARQAGILDIRTTYIREYTPDKHGRTDDYPYGGGPGMLMQCEPLYRALLAATEGEKVHTVLMSARGSVFTQKKARELLERGRFVLVCGHYEGIDARFIDKYVHEEISLGDYVISGGEIAAIAVADAVCRMVPGVLADDESFEEESHFSGLLEYPQYTRPENWQGMRVPEVLLSGHHENIRKWRRKMSLEITRERRPDMFARLTLSPEDKRLLED